MRASRALLSAAAVVVVIGVAVPQVAPEESKPEPKAQPQRIAVIDAEYVLRHMVDVKKGREELQSGRQVAEQRCRRDRDAILKLEQQIENFRPDSDDYGKIEQEIATRQADLRVLIELQERAFRRQEAKMMHAALARLEAAVAAWAKENAVTAVLQIDRAPTVPWDPDGVSRAVKRQVFYHVDTIDITDLMLAQLNDPATKEKKSEASLRTQNR